MSAGVVPPLEASPETLPRKRFTRSDVERMEAAGVFEGQRFELIDGDLIDKMGQKPPHASGIRRLLRVLGRLFDLGLVRVQLPMEASAADRETTLPEPDFAVVAVDKPDYEARHPQGNELVLVIEVSDSTVSFDLNRKAALYAAAGVPEYWVLDVVRRRLIVHKQPEGADYRLRQLLSENDSVSIEGRAETICVRDLLPPA